MQVNQRALLQISTLPCKGSTETRAGFQPANNFCFQANTNVIWRKHLVNLHFRKIPTKILLRNNKTKILEKENNNFYENFAFL